MGRPNKHNLHYFPLDVNFFEDHKVIMIENDAGVKGGYLAIRLMAMVYEQGYYLDWKDKSEISIAKRVGNGITGALVVEVLTSCLNHGLFDRQMFDEKKVLTSSGIQKRWLQVMQQLRRKVEISSELNLVTSEDKPVSSEETHPPETLSTQKEKKLNKRKGKNTGPPPPQNCKENILQFIAGGYPRLIEIKHPAAKVCSESDFQTYSRFVQVCDKEEKFQRLFRQDFINLQDFTKLSKAGFSESRWAPVVEHMLGSGLNENQNLFFRLKQFLGYVLEKEQKANPSQTITNTQKVEYLT